jgi:hypothetical protein
LYAISSRGSEAGFPDRSAVHPDDQAYLPGWPVKLGQLGLEVLPTIGDGVATQVAAGDVNPHPGVEIIAATAAGPPYVLGVGSLRVRAGRRARHRRPPARRPRR